MKKALAILVAMILTLACAAAMAETVKFVEDSPYFDIEMPLPEGAAVGNKSGTDMMSMVEITSPGLATVRITIAYSEIYDDSQSMNDLGEAEVESLKQMAGSQFEVPEMNVDATPSGNKYIHICANSEYDIDSIFTLYKGYFVELTQWHDDYSEITEKDYAFMQQLLYNIEFLPVA